MLRIKKDNPFPKYTVIKLLIAGVISGILASVITLLGAIISLVIQIGPENLPALFNAETAKEILDQLAAQGKTPLTWGSALLIFCRTFVLVGLAEEVMKFFCAKAVMKKEGVVRTWMDALICFAIVAIGFQASEDIGYAEGNVVLAIIRAFRASGKPILSGKQEQDFLAHDFFFHLQLLKAAGNRLAEKIVTTAYRRNRFFGLHSHKRDLNHLAWTWRYHRRMADAILANDAAAAVFWMRQHIIRSKKDALRQFDRQHE